MAQLKWKLDREINLKCNVAMNLFQFVEQKMMSFSYIRVIIIGAVCLVCAIANDDYDYDDDNNNRSFFHTPPLLGHGLQMETTEASQANNATTTTPLPMDIDYAWFAIQFLILWNQKQNPVMQARINCLLDDQTFHGMVQSRKKYIKAIRELKNIQMSDRLDSLCGIRLAAVEDVRQNYENNCSEDSAQCLNTFHNETFRLPLQGLCDYSNNESYLNWKTNKLTKSIQKVLHKIYGF